MTLFVWPFVFLLLPLPWVVRRFWAVSPQNKRLTAPALRVPFFDRLVAARSGSGVAPVPPPLFLMLSWFFLVTALARPVWFDTQTPLTRQARNLVLALDVSGSMQARDFDTAGHPVTRLALVKQTAADFVRRRAGDRVGLVLFGTQAHTYAPLSADTTALTALLDEITPGIAGDMTALGDAAALAVKNVLAAPDGTRVLILLSDGYANTGGVSPEDAAALAARHGIRIYTLGIGSDQQQIRDFFGLLQTNPAADLDEATLQKMAETTGGRYFRAKSAADLAEIYRAIDALETEKTEQNALRPRRELFFAPLLIALILLGLSVFFQEQNR